MRNGWWPAQNDVVHSSGSVGGHLKPFGGCSEAAEGVDGTSGDRWDAAPCASGAHCANRKSRTLYPKLPLAALRSMAKHPV